MPRYRTHKKESALKIAKKALSLAKGAVMPYRTGETNVITTVTNSVPILLYLNPSIAGAIYGEGVTQIKLKKLHINFDMVNQGTSIKTLRMDIIHDKFPNGTVLTAAQFTTLVFGTANPPMTAFLEPDLDERFKCIYSKRFTCNPSIDSKALDGFKSFNINKICKNSFSTGAFDYTSVETNAYFALVWTNDVSVAAPYVNITSEWQVEIQ